ncbi:MAG TPA: DUF1572 family protein, partial [Planctomycetota bacterium]|nr:DUF1572 family protein [Planctomycetota bacterium]
MSAGRGAFLDDALIQFRKHKAMAERAMAQIADAQFFAAPGPDENSVALLVKHVAGNQRSRWTDFLTSDGEKPDRHRDEEFERRPDDTRASLMARWEDGWRLLFAALEPLGEADLVRGVTIRGEPHSVLQAVARQLTHYAYHVGQIVALARHHAGAGWKSLSIPRGMSAQ